MFRDSIYLALAVILQKMSCNKADTVLKRKWCFQTKMDIKSFLNGKSIAYNKHAMAL